MSQWYKYLARVSYDIVVTLITQRTGGICQGRRIIEIRQGQCLLVT
jgi:hypothetical protein